MRERVIVITVVLQGFSKKADFYSIKRILSWSEPKACLIDFFFLFSPYNREKERNSSCEHKASQNRTTQSNLQCEGH